MLIFAIASLTTSPWHAPAGVCLGFVFAACIATRVAGLKGVDALGVATCAIELMALALTVLPPRKANRRPVV